LLLLAIPPTVTPTNPVAAVAGTVAVICVSDQGPRVALIPANVTVLLPGVAPKPLPLICTCVPGGPFEGVTLVMSGLGTVNKIS